MESGFPRSTMDAQRRPSLSALGVRNTQSSEERAEDRERDEATEEREAGLLRQPPMLKLRGRELSLDDYIRENRERFAPHHDPLTAIVRDLNYSVTVKRSGKIPTLANMFGKKPPKKELEILKNVSFALKPREMTVLLGASKSGKTALLDILACRRGGNISGVLNVNRQAPQDVPEAYHRLIGYVQQGDLHMPYLTVEETFKFSAFLRMPEWYPKEAREDRVEALLQLLGLDRSRNTQIGDEFRRGVSGGEKRRVTVGVEWAKGARLMLLDEPTTGLDASAALNIGRALRTISSTGIPVLCALLQPGNELLSLFDNLLLITRGQVAYWGPIRDAVPYFEELGFRCPHEYSEAEFLASVVERPADFLDEESGQGRNTPEALVAAWEASAKRRDMVQQLQPPGQPCTEFNFKKLPVSYPVSIWTQLYWLMWRGAKKLMRNWRRELLDYIITIIFGLIIGFFFFQRGNHQVDLRARLAVLFYAIARLAFNSLSVIPTLYIERAVFYRQVGARYYSEIPYALQNILINIPLGIVDVMSFGAIVYWVSGLFPSAWRFLYFCLILFVLRQTMNVFALLLSATVPAPIIASLIASSTSIIFILFSGFLIIRTRLPSFWKFGPYISPIHYVFDGLALNELHEQPFTCTAGELQPPASTPGFNLPYPAGFAGSQICQFTVGDQYLAFQALSTHWWHRWGDLAVVFGFWIGFSALLVLALRYLSFAGFVEPTGVEDVSGRLERVKKNAERAAQLAHPGATLTWTNLTYRVPQRRLLNNVSGFVRPGMLLALMGASGAGKTTLLDVLARRKNVGTTEGDVLINNMKPDKTFHRYIGYVEQNDIHLPSQTVLEAVSFAARSRLPETMTEAERSAIVQRVLTLLDLTPIAGQQVGLVGGLNPEQRKRLTIAVELAANPQILFLDEPTSGLDAAGADWVMTAVSQIAEAGTSVICTIHQPSSRIFALCTHLLLLQEGGEVMYFGPVGDRFRDVLGYFSRTFDRRPAANANPADFILTMSRVQDGSPPPAEVWRDTPEAKKALEDLEEAKKDEGGEKFTKRYPLSLWRQMGLSWTRNWLGIWRNPFQAVLDIIRSIFLGIVFGTIFWMRPLDQLGVGEQFGAIYFSAVFANLSSFAYLPAVYFQRPLFARERAEGFYRTTAYVFGLLGANIPFLLLNIVLFSAPFYWLSGLKREAGAFFFYLLVVFALTLVAVAFAHLVAVWSPTPVTAGILFASTFAFFALVAGFLLPQGQQPKYFVWGYWISFFHWFLEPLSVNNFAGRVVHCSASQFLQIPITLASGETVYQPFCPVTSGDQVLNALDVSKSRKWVGVGVLFGIYAAFVVLTIVGLRILRPIKR